MTGMIILRVFGDVCLCFSVIGALPQLFVHDFVLLYPALLCAAGAGLAAWLRRFNTSWTKFAAMALPVASLLFADTLMECLILVPVIIYTGAVILRGDYGFEYYTFREQFIRVCTGLGGFAAIIFGFGYFEGMVGQSWTVYDIRSTLLYGLLYVFTGVFLLRQLRMGADSQPKDRLRNNIQMLLVLAVIIAVTLAVVSSAEMMREQISALFGAIMTVVGFIPVVIQEIIYWFEKNDGGSFQTAVNDAASRPSESVPVTYPDLQGAAPAPSPEQGFPWWFAILILVMLCVGIVYLLRTLGKGSGGGGSVETLEQIELRQPGTREPRRSNRNKVRRLYRSYLKLVRRKGLRLRTDHTSEDILRESPENTDTDAAARLRRVYVKARYSAGTIVTNQEVEDAKAALKQVEKHKL